MSRLYLHCCLCRRQQADGLFSRGYWGHVDLGNGTTRRACPTCKQSHRDWEARVRATVATSVVQDQGGYRVSSYGVGA